MKWTRLAILVLAVAGPALAMDAPESTVSSETNATTDALNLYVETTGVDSAICGTQTSPCLTIQGAVDRIPKLVKHPVVVTVGTGTFATGANISGFAFDTGQSAARQASITVQGTLSNYAPATGTATGTLTAVNNGSASSPTWAVWTDNTQSWTVNDLVGRIVEFTGGGVGSATIASVIMSNTATTITIGGRYAELVPTTATTYRIATWSTTITGNSAVTYRLTSGNHIWINRMAAFMVNVPDAVQTGNESTVNIQKFQFDGALSVSNGVLVLNNGSVGVKWNKVPTSVTTFNRLVQYEGNGHLGVHGNVIFGVSTTNAVNMESYGFAQGVKLVGNYMVGGNCLGCFIGLIGDFQAFGNYVDLTGSAGSPYRFGNVLDGSIRHDQLTGGAFCVRGFGNTAGSDSSNFAIDGTQCNNQTDRKFSFNGGTWKFDSLGIGASTGTNTSNTTLIIMGTGTKVQWSSSTNFTVSGGASDFCINDVGFTTECITQAQLRLITTNKSFTSLSASTTIGEP